VWTDRTSLADNRLFTEEGFYEVYEMQWAHDRGSFSGHARKLFADVDEGFAVFVMRQHRGSIDPLSPCGSPRPKSHAARIPVDANGGSPDTCSLAGQQAAGRPVLDEPRAARRTEQSLSVSSYTWQVRKSDSIQRMAAA
jgi:hypothetical protein